MANELHKYLVNYFTHVAKLEEKWKELLASAEKPLSVLKSQTEQLRLVKSAEVDNAELCQEEEFRDRLIFKILMRIENEMSVLLNIIMRFNNANQDLRNRLSHLETLRSKVSLKDPEMSELVNGTPDRPRLNLLLEWAIDSFKYYDNLYQHINQCMKQLKYEDEETIENLSKSFVEDFFKRRRINRILTFTQFLIKENVH